ncbi:MAG: DNA recombination/repair protein RecA, partial [Candidatus Promineofilum sp.]|nr:DNA recombination/repair protein RecA [Promineifilum sp.]
VIGNRTRVKVKKNKVAPPFTECEFDIMYNEGISRTGDVLDLAINNNLLDKRGAFIRYGDTLLGQGRENAKIYLAENPAMLDELETRIRQMAGLPTIAAH